MALLNGHLLFPLFPLFPAVSCCFQQLLRHLATGPPYSSVPCVVSNEETLEGFYERNLLACKNKRFSSNFFSAQAEDFSRDICCKKGKLVFLKSRFESGREGEDTFSGRDAETFPQKRFQGQEGTCQGSISTPGAPG